MLFKQMVSAIMNEGEDCYNDCGYQNGPCSWCGEEGLCCRIGNDYISDWCDGTFGGQTRHECVLKPG